jgi:hypothetical protein
VARETRRPGLDGLTLIDVMSGRHDVCGGARPSFANDHARPFAKRERTSLEAGVQTVNARVT